jgi:hypothetical protein
MTDQKASFLKKNDTFKLTPVLYDSKDQQKYKLWKSTLEMNLALHLVSDFIKADVTPADASIPEKLKSVPNIKVLGKKVNQLSSEESYNFVLAKSIILESLDTDLRNELFSFSYPYFMFAYLTHKAESLTSLQKTQLKVAFSQLTRNDGEPFLKFIDRMNLSIAQLGSLLSNPDKLYVIQKAMLNDVALSTIFATYNTRIIADGKDLIYEELVEYVESRKVRLEKR